MLVQVQDRVFVAANDPNPLRCPECKTLFFRAGKGGPRCPGCHHHGKAEEFQVKFIEIAQARVLVAAD